MTELAKNSEALVVQLEAVDKFREAWPAMTVGERRAAFSSLSRTEAEELFLHLSATDQAEQLADLSPAERRSWLRLLAPDDAADLIQSTGVEQRDAMLALLDSGTLREVTALLAYAEDDAGGLMNPQFARLRPDMMVDEAIAYLRAQAKSRAETIYYGYVLDFEQRLLGVVSFRQLISASTDKRVRELMQTDVVTIPEHMDQEEVGQLFSQNSLMAIPVLDQQGKMKGIVTVDDAVEVVQEEATEDIQKMGGTGALGEPYLKVGVAHMLRKRAGWLIFLFLGEMFTATAMQYYAAEIERAVVLALFVPLIISSGGNSGSQATTLIIRAMALGEVRLRDWWRVFLKEVLAGLGLGLILGGIGFLRILLWPARVSAYGEHYWLIAFTVAGSLLGVVLWGSLMGAMLPLLLRRLGFDPATASAPFVATLVDVTGLIIYFSVASQILAGTLL